MHERVDIFSPFWLYLPVHSPSYHFILKLEPSSTIKLQRRSALVDAINCFPDLNGLFPPPTRTAGGTESS